MPSHRPPRPARRAAPSPELIDAVARMLAVLDFKDACHERAWAKARADGSRRCGEAEFDAAEAEVIASGHARPPESWFAPDPILDDWFRDLV